MSSGPRIGLARLHPKRMRPRSPKFDASPSTAVGQFGKGNQSQRIFGNLLRKSVGIFYIIPGLRRSPFQVGTHCVGARRTGVVESPETFSISREGHRKQRVRHENPHRFRKPWRPNPNFARGIGKRKTPPVLRDSRLTALPERRPRHPRAMSSACNDDLDGSVLVHDRELSEHVIRDAEDCRVACQRDRGRRRRIAIEDGYLPSSGQRHRVTCFVKRHDSDRFARKLMGCVMTAAVIVRFHVRRAHRMLVS